MNIPAVAFSDQPEPLQKGISCLLNCPHRQLRAIMPYAVAP